MEPNPYEVALEASRRTKRRIGLILALTVTPVATFIAFFATCSYNFYWDVQKLPPSQKQFIPEYIPTLIVFGVMGGLTLLAFVVSRLWRAGFGRG